MSRSSKASVNRLVGSAKRGDRRALARLMSLVENDPQARVKILSSIYWRMNNARIVGITGPPGSGKSTLIAQLARRYSDTGHTVGIVAVDPSSQLTGGALLGDRIRMGELSSDPKIFIRSMATRGHFGGIARATEDVVRVFDASGVNYVIVETAGAGQSDVDVRNFVHTTVVVTAPGMGDEIQALKAGIMEIGDIFVINKADMEGADRSAQEILSMIMMTNPTDGWRPRVVKTVATTGDGVVGLTEAIDQHSEFLKQNSQQAREPGQLRQNVLAATKRYFEEIVLSEIASSDKFEKLTRKVEAHQLNPYGAARLLLSDLTRQLRDSERRRIQSNSGMRRS